MSRVLISRTAQNPTVVVGVGCEIGPDTPPTYFRREHPTARSAILRDADELINGDRAAAYGPPAENFQKVADGWSIILGHPVAPEQVALCMAWLKIARLTNGPHRDSYVDGAGYLALAGELSGD